MMKAGVDLQHAETERRRDPEHRSQHGKYIDGMSDQTMNAPSDQREKGGANGKRQPAPEGEIGKRQPDHDINRPGMKSSVKEGAHQCLPVPLYAAPLSDRRGGRM